SVFHYYRQLIALRKKIGVIADGDYTDLLPDDQALHVYRRQCDGQVLICLNNYSADRVAFDLSCLSDLSVSRGETLLANYNDEQAGEISLTGRLRPFESRIWLFT